MGSVFAIANQKGGVGKTTTALNLAAFIAQAGRRTLLVDVDPQGNATTGLGVARDDTSGSVYEALLGQMQAPALVKATAVQGLDLLPSQPHLAGAEVELVEVESREMRLKNILDGFRSQYDYIIIDCPPSLGLLTVNSLVAADGVIIPVQCEYYALEGLKQLLAAVRLVRDGLNPQLEIRGVVLTMADMRTNLARQVADEVRAFFGAKAFGTVIPRCVRLAEAPSYGMPVVSYDAACAGAEAYRELAKELMGNGKEGSG